MDPDNRRPVDYPRRAEMLEALSEVAEVSADQRAARLAELWAGDGSAAKLFVVSRSLALRREEAELFRRGGYTAILAEGARAEHVIAFARRHGGRGVIAIASRLHVALLEQARRLPLGRETWGDTRVMLPFLAEGAALADAFSGRTLKVRDGGIALADAFALFPGALLRFTEDGAV